MSASSTGINAFFPETPQQIGLLRILPYGNLFRNGNAENGVTALLAAHGSIMEKKKNCKDFVRILRLKCNNRLLS
jgi:hypothetical protein